MVPDWNFSPVFSAFQPINMSHVTWLILGQPFEWVFGEQGSSGHFIVGKSCSKRFLDNLVHFLVKSGHLVWFQFRWLNIRRIDTLNKVCLNSMVREAQKSKMNNSRNFIKYIKNRQKSYMRMASRIRGEVTLFFFSELILTLVSKMP